MNRIQNPNNLSKNEKSLNSDAQLEKIIKTRLKQLNQAIFHIQAKDSGRSSSAQPKIIEETKQRAQTAISRRSRPRTVLKRQNHSVKPLILGISSMTTETPKTNYTPNNNVPSFMNIPAFGMVCSEKSFSGPAHKTSSRPNLGAD